MCATRGERTLDHCYIPFKRGYKANFLPEYKQSIVREVGVMRDAKRLSEKQIFRTP